MNYRSCWHKKVFSGENACVLGYVAYGNVANHFVFVSSAENTRALCLFSRFYFVTLQLLT